MNRNLIITFLILVIIYAGFTIYNQDNLSKQIQNPQYQEYLQEYRKLVNEKVLKTVQQHEENADFDMQYKSGSTSGTTGNFEGPQVHLKGIKFHNEYLTEENIGKRLKHFDAVSAHFDPDHSYFGLPDVKISLKDVRLYKMEKGALSEFLNFGESNEPKPYKIYKKRIVDDSLGLSSKYFVMQLWLTEFDVTIDIRPDRDIPVNISEKELNETKYPGYWYGSSQKEIKLKDLGKEHKDFRYGDLSFILEIIPDNSPIYLKTKNGETSKADFAIGAIYCKNAIFGNEPNVQRISTNIHAGQPVFLNNENVFEKMNLNLHSLSPNLETNAENILQMKAENENFIWNKPYYIKLFFNNLGTWRSGVFNQNQFHDQVSYSFLMPIFVVGSWDVVVPQDILPEWNPPEPFVRKLSFKSLLPFYNMGFLGKLGSIIFLFLVLFITFSIIFPGFIPLIRKVFRNNK